MKSYHQKFGNLNFYSTHPILDQMASELIRGLPKDLAFSSRKIYIFVGCHRIPIWAYLRVGYKISIQTENFYDFYGMKLWGSGKKLIRLKLFMSLIFSNLVLDLNYSNLIFYKKIHIPKKFLLKIRFGPHIFPFNKTVASENQGEGVIFFGGLSDRRKKLLELFDQKKIKVLKKHTYGLGLYGEISGSRAILNLHFNDGVYTEAPRFLTAIICGKCIVSESVGPPFEEGKHYIGIDKLAKNIDFTGDCEQIFTNLVDLTTNKLSFYNFLISNEVIDVTVKV